MTELPSELLPNIPGFEILEEIGRGATSRVFRACQVTLDREVALKIITTLGEKGRRRAVRLFREARLSGALDHSGIVRGIDAGEGDGSCWFAMDLVDGESLQELLDREEHMPLGEVLGLAEALLEALDHAHRRGVTHRDIKPANILIDIDGVPRILDLGLARRQADPTLTGEGAVGTPQYMAPEQAREPTKVDGRSDIFSLGATLYRALCGVPPFDGETVGEVLSNVLHGDPVRPSAHVDGLPQAVDLVMQRMLEKRTEHRYQSATEALADVRALREGRRPRARPRGRWRRSLMVAGAVVVGVSGWGLVAALNGDRAHRDESSVQPGSAVDAAARAHAELDRITRDTRQNIGDRLFRALQQSDRLPDDDVRAREVVAHLEIAYFGAVEEAIGRAEEGAVASLSAGAPVHLDPESLELGVYAEAFSVTRGDYASRVRGLCRQASARVERRLNAHRAMVAAEIVDAMDTWLADNRTSLLADSVAIFALDAIEVEHGPVSLLTAEQRALILTTRGRVRAALSAHPQREWESAVADVERQIEALRLESARRILERARTRVGDLIPTGQSEVEGLLRMISMQQDQEIRAARAIPELARRHGVAGLATGEQRLRIESMRGAIDRYRDPDEIVGMNVELAVAMRLVVCLEGAVNLRDHVLGSVGALVAGAGTKFRPRRRHQGYVRSRRLLGRNGRVLLARDAVGQPRTYDVDDLLAPCLLELAKAAGLDADAAFGAWLAYMDGDDDLALELSTALQESELTRETLLRFSREAVERRLDTFDVAADREAYGRLVEARGCIASGDLEGARAALDTADRALRRGGKGWAARRFWREFGKEVRALRNDLEIHGRLEAAWRDFGSHVRSDVEARRVILSLPLGTRTAGIKAIAPPARTVSASDGLRLMGSDHLATTPPDRLPPLRISLPPLADAAIDLRFQVVFESGRFPPAFLVVALHDVSFVLFDTVLDGRMFRSLPLHGLERGLHRPRRVGAAGIWVGALEDYEARLVRPKKAARIPRDKPLGVRLACGPGGQDLEVWLGDDHVFRLAGARRPCLEDGDLRITGFPTVRVSDLRLDVRWLAPEK